jgi:hypothetical protein
MWSNCRINGTWRDIKMLFVIKKLFDDDGDEQNSVVDRWKQLLQAHIEKKTIPKSAFIRKIDIVFCILLSYQQ